MRKLRATILAGAGALLAAGAAQAAAETHRMNVALPGGSIAQIEYTGDVAPKVIVEPVAAPRPIAFEPFAAFERIAAMMEAHRRAMLLQMAALERAAAQATALHPGQFTLAGQMPAGARYTYVSSVTDANGCTRTVEYRSDGGGQPMVSRASAGNCEGIQRNAAPIPAGTIASAAQPQGRMI